MRLFSSHPRATRAITAAVILFAGIRLLKNSTQTPHREAIDQYYQELALQLRMAAEDLPRGTDVVVLGYAQELEAGDEKQFRQVLRSLKKEGVSVLHAEPLVYDEEAGWSGSKMGFPYSEFLRVVRENPDADAVLSICGLPYGVNDAEPGNRADLPPLLIARIEGEGRTAIDRLLNEGWIQAAVVLQEGSGQDESPRGYDVVGEPVPDVD